MIKLRVYGTPVPQGSMNAFAVRKGGVPTGRVAVTHDNKTQLRSWRAAIGDAVAQARGLDNPHAWPPEHGAVAVTLMFVLARPAGHYGTGRNAAQVRPGAPAYPVGKRDDLDKLSRAVLDALTDAGIWRDDGQVTALTAGKIYAGYDDRPGCEIEVSPLG